MNRRTFLRRLSGLGVGLALADSFLPARRVVADQVTPSLGSMAYQLGWIKDFQFAGEYIADYKQYYQRCGLQVDLLAGGPNIIVDAMIASGKALVGQSSSVFMANAISRGARLKSIGVVYQKSNACIISMAKTPLRNPRDLIGKKIGIQIINLVIWRAFLKVNKIAPDEVTTIPVQFEFTPLLAGEVDGFYGLMNVDYVDLKTQGYDVHPLRFADFGLRILGGNFSVLASSLQDKVKRAQLVAFMKAEVLGWQDELKDPTLGADLTVDVYARGNGLNRANQRACCLANSDYIVSADTQKHGLFWMTPEAADETISSLAASGAKATPDMFTNEILEEVYQGKASL